MSYNPGFSFAQAVRDIRIQDAGGDPDDQENQVHVPRNPPFFGGGPVLGRIDAGVSAYQRRQQSIANIRANAVRIHALARAVAAARERRRVYQFFYGPHRYTYYNRNRGSQVGPQRRR